MSLLETRDMQATIVKQLLGEQDDANLDKHRYIERLVEIADLESAEHQSLIDPFAVSYTHLTLPTIYSV